MNVGRWAAWGLETVKRGGLPAIAIFLFHAVASLGFNAYEHFPPLDIPMHFFGGVAIAYFFHCASIAASDHGIIGPFHRVTHVVLVFALTCSATVFWEFAEFLADRGFNAGAQNGLDDTLGDMFLGVCGGVGFLVVAPFAARRREMTNGKLG